MAVRPARSAAPGAKTVKAAAAKAPAKSRTAAAGKPAVADGSKGETLLRAGLKALGEVRDGVVQRQNRVVETLLGDSLGFRKLEDVFDQRIAAALERLGIPSAGELATLREEVRMLMEERGSNATPPTRRKR